jgi:hypothetical protein
MEVRSFTITFSRWLTDHCSRKHDPVVPAFKMNFRWGVAKPQGHLRGRQAFVKAWAQAATPWRNPSNTFGCAAPQSAARSNRVEWIDGRNAAFYAAFYAAFLAVAQGDHWAWRYEIGSCLATGM